MTRGRGGASPSHPRWESHGRSDFTNLYPRPPVSPLRTSGGTRSRALPAPTRNKKELTRVSYIPGISKVEDKVEDAWHQKDDLKDKSKKDMQKVTSLCLGNKDHRK
jgi:hypothetical protein